MVGCALAAAYGPPTSFLLAMPFATSGMPPPLSAETLPEHARLFQKGIWWRNAREQAVAAVLIVLSYPGLTRDICRGYDARHMSR